MNFTPHFHWPETAGKSRSEALEKNNDKFRQQFVVYDTGLLNFSQDSMILI